MHTVLLVIHIFSVIVWLGAGTGATYIGSRFIAEGGVVAAKWLRISESMGPRFYGPASGLTLLSGIALVFSSDVYRFGSLFVILGLAVWILLAIGNGAFLGKREKQALEAFERGDDQAGQETIRRLNGFITVEFLLLAVIVIAMIYRWGA